jgi:hypothetical protein
VSGVAGEWAHPPLMRSVAAAYERNGIAVIRRAMLFGQAGLTLVIALGGPLLTKLFVPFLSVADLALLVGLAWVIYLIDGALAVLAIRPQLQMLERWAQTRDNAALDAAWLAASDVPFAPLRQPLAAVLYVGLAATWDLLTCSLVGLPMRSLPTNS